MAVLAYSGVSTPSLLARIGKALLNAGEAFVEARSRSAEFQYYTDMSDAQLAEKGMRREDIALHVFRDHLL